MPNSRCIETGAREGVYLGSQLPVDALPGKAGQNRARPGAALDRCKYILMKLPEMELFSYFFEASRCKYILMKLPEGFAL